MGWPLAYILPCLCVLVCSQQANGTMPAPARRVRLHRAIGSDSVYAGLDTFQGALDAVSVWSVALTRADIQAAMLDTSSFWAIGVCVTEDPPYFEVARSILLHVGVGIVECEPGFHHTVRLFATAHACVVTFPTFRAHFRRGLLVHVRAIVATRHAPRRQDVLRH